MDFYVILSGSSSGIGLACLKELDQNNFHVLSLSRSPIDITFSKGNLCHQILDLKKLTITQSNSLISNFLKTIQSFDQVILINNAGQLGPMGMIKDLNLDEVRDSFDLNFFSAALLTQSFLKYSSPSNPSLIINITTGAATNPYAGWLAYCSSKAAFQMLGSVAQEENPQLKVINFSPGPTQTAMQEEIRKSNPRIFPLQEKFIKLHEENKLNSPKDVAKKILNIIRNPNQLPLLVKFTDLN